MGIKIWFKACRLPFLTATFVPVILGGTIAWYEVARFNWFNFILTLIGISCLHLGTNLTNDYFDHKTKNDELNLNPTPFSGGSRVIQEGLISPKKNLSCGFKFFCSRFSNRAIS
jgi:1,4-dihydroxy-2-naphthoate octaprenyltransferase